MQTECNWPLVAERYAAVSRSRWSRGKPLEETAAANRNASQQLSQRPVAPAYIRSWATDDGSKSYVETHFTRLAKTLEITPRGGPAIAFSRWARICKSRPR